jgi:hypothetical protein
MLFVLFAAIAFAFLFLGAVAFLACIPLPQTRRYALSVALWFAAWGPCIVIWMVVAGLGLIAVGLLTKTAHIDWTSILRLLSALGWGYVAIGALFATFIATGAAWFHQLLIHRFTFALFRLYATMVSAGIGSVLGWSFGWWIIAKGTIHFAALLWVLVMLLLTVGFGLVAYRGARALRGQAPTRFTWISPEEFVGSGEP